MRFSIIVPIYNVEAFIRQCVDSVLNQSYKDFELILVDDGSPDGCPAICDTYAKRDKRVHVIHKPNGGLVSARKAGAVIARGDYSICLDGDDYFELHLLECLNNIIEYHNPDIIAHGYFEFGGSEKIQRPLIRYKKGYYDRSMIEREFFPSLLSSKFPPSVWGKAFRTSIYREEQLAVPDTIKIGEDFAVTKPLLYRANSVYILEECLYYYRMNPKSMTKEKAFLDLDNYEFKFKHISSRINLDEKNFRQQLYWNTSHGLFNAIVSQFYRNESYFRICKLISKTLDRPIYKECINSVSFRTFSKKIMLMSMKHRLYFLMYIYNKLK